MKPMATCTTCDGSGRIRCPGPHTYGLTQGQMKSAGLREFIDYCYGLHMGHECPDCGAASGSNPEAVR